MNYQIKLILVCTFSIFIINTDSLHAHNLESENCNILENVNASSNPGELKWRFPKVKIWVQLALPGECLSGYGVCAGIEIEMENITPGKKDVVDLMALSERTMQLKVISSSLKEALTKDVFLVDKDIKLSKDLARNLGFEEVSLVAGRYAVDRSSSPLGEIIIPIQTK